MCALKLSRAWVENGWIVPPLPYMFPLKSRGWVGNRWNYISTYHVGRLRIGGALPPLPKICPLNFSLGWVENGWSSTSTPQHVSTGLRMGGALTPLPFMCRTKFLSSFWVENGWSSTSTPNICPLNLSRGWVENRWSCTSTPQHVSFTNPHGGTMPF